MKKFKFDTSDFEPLSKGDNAFTPHDFEPLSKNEPSKPINLFPKPMSEEKEKEFRDTARQTLKHAAIGGAQGLANFPSDTAELLNPTSHKVPRFNFAPNTEASKIGQMIAPFAGPQAVESGALKALQYAPKALNYLKKYSATAKANPIKNALLKSGKTAAEVGYINALENPNNSKKEFLKGAAIGGPFGLLGSVAAQGSKYLPYLAKAGMGALIGSQFGHPYMGAAAGIGFPVRGALGMESANKISEDMLSGLHEKDVSKAVNASRRLGTNITPGEASGNYVRGAQEGALKRTAGGGQLGYRLEESEKYKQNNSINKMLDTIYKPTKENENHINKLYKKAYQHDVDPTVVAAMMQNPIMRNAIEKVQLDPAFADIAHNNYEFLAQVNRTMRKESNSLASSSVGSERVSAHHMELNRKPFDNFLKKNNPDYEKATEAAHGKLTRQEIERKGNKELEDLTAKSFYSKFLTNRKPYQEILRQTKNFPEAQKMIRDMRSGWKNLSSIKTVGQSEAQSKSSIDQMRNLGNYFITMIKNIAGAKGDIARLKFIYSPDWEKGFKQRAMIQDKNKRINEISSYIVNSGLKAGIAKNKMDNLIGVLNEKD